MSCMKKTDATIARISITCRVQNPDIPQAGRVGAHGGVVGQGRAGLFANRTVRLGHNPPPHSPPVESKTRTYHGPGGVGQDGVPTELFA